MARVMVVALINMLLGLIVGKGFLSIYYTEQVWPVLSIAVFLCLIITAVVWLLIRPAEEDLKKAEDKLKEGETYWVLSQISGIEGNLALVRSKKTKELKLLVFKEVPPTIFKKEKGKIVSYDAS